jgi:hypothetical protein
MHHEGRQLARFGFLAVASLYSRLKTKPSRFPFNSGEVP